MNKDLLIWLYKYLFPRWIKNALALSVIELERFHPPRKSTLPPGRRALVLAPHADDESIGCGGTLRKLVNSGAAVKVIFITDGSQGDPNLRNLDSDDKQRQRLEHQLVSRRKAEAGDALQTLGITEYEFIDAKDGAVTEDMDKIADMLAQTITHWKPDIVILPFITDRHHDHFATNKCFIEAINRLQDSSTENIQCLGYEIWSPIYANLLIDITATMAQKLDAIRCYQSQLEHDDYLGGIEGLNRYRAVSGLTGSEYAEAFFLAPLPVYQDLFHKLLR
jgi:LmbE family N-acetylglucosaminyl deacetylase